MIADVDVASIITGLQSGSSFGYRLVFIELILIAPLATIQYASGALGIVTGHGIGEAVRLHWGKKYSSVAALPMATIDFMTYVAEYAGIGIGFALIGISPVIGIFIAFVLHNVMVITGGYRHIESILLLITVVLILAIIAAVLFSTPNLTSILFIGMNPLQPYGNRDYQYLMAANIGAVIMPWMLFYQAGAAVEKKIQKTSLRFHRNETLLGAVVSEILMAAIVLAGMKINMASILTPGDLASLLAALGPAGTYIMSVGLISAGFLALIVASLGSAWGVAEVLNWSRRLDSKFSEQKKFYTLFIMESFPAAITGLLITGNLVSAILNLMVVYVVVLLPIGVMLGLLVSDVRVMGAEKFSLSSKILYWAMLVAVEAGGFVGLLSIFQ
ncbi:MAG: divalent metal cation transporter [Candidatus Thermoplasmatota archaeon]|nr:divalent metal cation transporter [Candidatus Thermoplasmatota archaeon]MCL6089873.1 divalent metal cation transporter [Candidatus Thermoplasmatota archaeon]MDA8143797.1 divalent metal cation transporter [Thermoplasmatales archaeon]